MTALTTHRTIERILTIAAGRKQVFRALLDPGTLSRWLFATVNLTAEQGGGYSFEWRDSAAPASAAGEILELVPDRKLVLSWTMEADGVTSAASFDLEDAPGGEGPAGGGGGTILRFQQTGLPGEPEWLLRFRQVGLEWDKVLLNLRFLLEEQGEGKHLFYLRTTVQVASSVQRAFRAWLSPTGLAAWMARDAFVVPEEGGELTGITLDTGRALTVHFHRIEADRHLRMSWSEGCVRGLLGVSFWPNDDGVAITLTLRSFALTEGERPIIQALWSRRFERLVQFLQRRPLGKTPVGTGSFTVRGEVEATPARAWAAFTDASLLRRWFVAWSDLEPRVGAEYVLLWNTSGELIGRVLEVKPCELLAFSWDLDALGETTHVVLRVLANAKQPGLCTVEITHSGWGEGPTWDEERSSHESGWAGVVAMLDFYLRKGAGKDPREFSYRRRLPVPPAKAHTLLSTAAGLTTWLATRATVEMQPGGRFEYEVDGKHEFKGHVPVCHPPMEAVVELTSPEPALIEWWLASDPDPQSSRLSVSFVTYTASERWFAARREEWRVAMDKLVGGR
jgi:uncharacterized protein YndB with AHSA1/START domain